MPSLPILLKKLEALHRQHVEVEHEIADVERQIVAAGKPDGCPVCKGRPVRCLVIWAAVVDEVQGDTDLLADFAAAVVRAGLCAVVAPAVFCGRVVEPQATERMP